MYKQVVDQNRNAILNENMIGSPTSAEIYARARLQSKHVFINYLLKLNTARK